MPSFQPRLFAFLFALACGGQQSLAAAGDTRARSKPLNLLVFLVDDLGWQDTSLAMIPGEPKRPKPFRTPHLQRLAEQGMLFTSAYASAPVCTPTRTSLMTGSSPARSHITFWTKEMAKDTSSKHPTLKAPDWRRSGLEEGDITLAGLLQENGYRTIHAGKAHWGAEGSSGSDPLALGFDRNFGGHAAGSPGSYLAREHFRRQNAKGRSNAEFWDVPDLEEYHGRDVFLTEALATEAAKEIRAAIKESMPFFLHFAPYSVHTPITANAKYLEHYPHLAEPEKQYASMIEDVDQALGFLLNTLEEQGVLDSTLVVFTSDNGGLAAHSRGGELHEQNAPLRSGKGSGYEGGVRVPWVMSWPGVIEAGSSTASSVITHDLFPTLLAAAGVKLPKDHAELVDGIDLGPLLRGNRLIREHPLLWHQPHMWGARGPGIEPFSSLRLGDEKLLWFHADQPYELYDLENDPGERDNLVGSQPERSREVAGLLAAELRRRKAQPSLSKAGSQPVAFEVSVDQEPAKTRAEPASKLGSDARPKGVVVIFFDDLAYGDLSCFGAHPNATPRMDRLAKEGMLSTDFYVSQPVCSASRASLLTGCYSNRIGIHGALFPDSKVGISAKEWTLAEACRSQGFQTAIFGKWHLGDSPNFLPTRHGFDEYYGIPYSNDMWPLHPESPDAWPPLPTYEGEKVLEYNGDQRRHTRDFTARAVKFLERNAEAERPFFLYVPHPQPHVPLHVAKEAEGATGRGLFADVIAELDRSVGEILDTLDRLELAKDTLVIVTSDNGPWLSYGQHAGSTAGLREGKGTTFEGGVRVPCLLRWPEVVPAGGVCREPWSTLDILPTIAARIGAELPDHTIDGRDAFELWSREQPKTRAGCDPDANGPRGPQEPLLFFYNTAELQALRLGRWKLHLAHSYRTMKGREVGQDGLQGNYDYGAKIQQSLFDLWTDPAEQHDVSGDHPLIVERMLRMAETAKGELSMGADGSLGRGMRKPGRKE